MAKIPAVLLVDVTMRGHPRYFLTASLQAQSQQPSQVPPPIPQRKGVFTPPTSPNSSLWGKNRNRAKTKRPDRSLEKVEVLC